MGRNISGYVPRRSACVVSLCIAAIVIVGCQSLHRLNLVKANSSAVQVYRDTNLEVWNVEKRCFYFLHNYLKYIYQCDEVNHIEPRKTEKRIHSAGAGTL